MNGSTDRPNVTQGHLHHLHAEHLTTLESSEDDKEIVYSQVLKSKGRTEVAPELQQKIHQFICGHPFIVGSPIKDDSVLVPDPLNPTKKVEKNKLLLQASVRV